MSSEESQKDSGEGLKTVGLGCLGIVVVIGVVTLVIGLVSDCGSSETDYPMSRSEAFDFCAHGILPDGRQVVGCYAQFPGGGGACIEQCLYRLEREGRTPPR